MTPIRSVISCTVLLANVLVGALPAQARWVCLDPDGWVSLETEESRTACCEHWQNVDSCETHTESQCVNIHDADHCACRDIALGTGDKAVQHSPDRAMSPEAVLLAFDLANLVTVAQLEVQPFRLPRLAHPPDSPSLASLKTVILLV